MIRSTFPLLLVAAASWGAVALPAGVHAAEGHSRLAVEAKVQSYCDIGGSPSLVLRRGLLDFGHHRLTAALPVPAGNELAQPVKGELPVMCSDRGVAPEISFDYGLHATGRQRNLQGPDGSLIPYMLLRGSHPSQGLWEDKAYPVPMTGDTLGDIPVYGYIPVLPANADDGIYTDTVSVRIDF